MSDLVTRLSKQATAATGQPRSLLLYHIFCSFYKPFITTLRVDAELDIPILITLSNRYIILHDVLVQHFQQHEH